ncbi:MAG: hypothetical protein OXT09_34290 [Myxococcales bacterium]|nr:hypothetical protein [Myxococcales bacterium]
MRSVLWALGVVAALTFGCDGDTSGDGDRSGGAARPAGSDPAVDDSTGGGGPAPIAGGMQGPGMAGPSNDPGTAGMGAGDDCGSIELEPNIEFEPGNLLILFDRSMSMATLFGGSDRRTEAGAALITALTPFVCGPQTDVDGAACVDKLNVAALMFPSYDAAAMPSGLDPTQLSCTVHDMTSSEQLPWQTATDFVAAWDPYWAARALVTDLAFQPLTMQPLVYGTPISTAFQRGAEALMDQNLTGNKAVLFLTDGEEVGMCAGVNGVTQATTWADEAIRTHVVSLAPPGGPGEVFNNDVAAAGGTVMPLYPTDAAALTAELSDIVISSIGKASCTVPLNGGRLQFWDEACEVGEVFVGPTKVPCDQANKADGFYIKDEGTIEIVGSYCTMLEEQGVLKASFPCTVILE